MKKFGFLFILSLLVCLLIPFAALAEMPALTNGSIGDNGVITPGSETPVTVTVKNGSEDFEGLLTADVYESQHYFVRYQMPVKLAANETKQFTLHILPRSDQPEYPVCLRKDDQIIAGLSLPASTLRTSSAALQPGLPLAAAANLAPVENHSSALPMMICLGVYLLIGIAGGYFLLKKWHRREWMWGLIPALSLLCVLSLSFLSRGQEYHTPAAVTICIYDLDENQVNAGAQVILPGTGDAAIAADGLDVSFTDHTFSPDMWATDQEARPQMTARYHRQENQQVILSPEEPWKSYNLRISNLPMEDVALTGWVQPDEKGLSGFVKNGSDQDFFLCALFTPAGCALLPPLKAGEQAEFSLHWAEEAYPEKAQYQSSMLSLPLAPWQPNLLAYQLSMPIRNENWAENAAMPRQFGYMQHYSFAQLTESILNYAWQINEKPCLFIGLTDTLGRFSLAADGTEITRQGHIAAVACSLNYRVHGEDGTLFYMPGALSPTLAALSAGVPQDTGNTAQNVQLTDEPVILCYSFPEAQEKAADHLLLWYDDSLNTIISYAAYDFEKAEWTELEGHSALFRGAEAQGLLQDGKMYLRIQSKKGYYPDGNLKLPAVSYLGREK